MRKLLLFILLIHLCFAQSELLNKVSHKYEKLEDFQAKVKILTDIPNFRMPIKTINIFYKTPDKMKIKSKGFTILPKKGILPFAYIKQLDNDSTAIDTSFVSMVGTKEMSRVTIVDTSVIKNGKINLLIDNYLERIESVSVIREEDTLSVVNFSYQNVDGFWIPDTTEFTFSMKKRLPRASGPSISSPFGSVDIASPEDHYHNNGRVSLIFHDVKINQGLEESFFDNQK